MITRLLSSLVKLEFILNEGSFQVISHRSFASQLSHIASYDLTKLLSIAIVIKSGLILGVRPANERRRYFITTSLIGWAQA